MLATPDPATGPAPLHPRRILGVGIATLDIVNEVADYPAEDSEIRALTQRRVRGGNVTNTLSVLAQLGHRCAWSGTLADDPASELILADLARHGIDTTQAVRIANTATPTSYVTLSRRTGSRSIVHHRDLPELDAAAFASTRMASPDWVHFEGRVPEETYRMLQMVRTAEPRARISVELEKPRPGIEVLFDGPDLILSGRAFAEARGFSDPHAFLEDLGRRTTAALCVLGWGAQGAYLLVRGAAIEHIPTEPPARVIDTLGAGDCLNAGIIDGLLRDMTPVQTLARAVRLAGLKCGHSGLAGLIAAAGITGWR